MWADPAQIDRAAPELAAGSLLRLPCAQAVHARRSVQGWASQAEEINQENRKAFAFSDSVLAGIWGVFRMLCKLRSTMCQTGIQSTLVDSSGV
jgi:hypothetical protein